ncbi:MAG: hypothetical protein M0P31_06205 [Solirubrobacteraceae bacterium]|nr:hypothetical protein [Solirubrobacteraceae bacterium]
MAPVETLGVDSPVSETGQLISTVLTFGLAAAAIVWVILLWRRERIVWPFFVLVGGTLTCLMEPAFDHLYGLWFNEAGQWHLYETFGSAQPIWVPPAYTAFYGGATILVVRTLARFPSMTTVWKMWGGLVVMALAAEISYVSILDVYEYQDSQPFVVAGYPVFLATTNAMSGIVGGIVIYRLVPYLRGIQRLALLTIVPMAFAADLFGTGIVYLSVRHGFEDPNMVLVHLAALTVSGGILATIVLMGRILVAGQPVRDPSLPAEPLPGEALAAARAATAAATPSAASAPDAASSTTDAGERDAPLVGAGR